MSVHHRLPMSCVIKALVALVVLYGHNAGSIDCDADIAVYLPELAGQQRRGTGITLRHLLTHSAGYVEPQENSARWGYTWDRFVEFFPHRKQAFEPGRVWSYTHTGYVLLQKAAEAAFGRDMDALLDELIFDHLGFRPQNFGELPASSPNVTSLHVKAPRTGRYEPMRPPLETGFLRYSISDLAISTEQMMTLAGVLSGARQDLPHMQKALEALLVPSMDLPAYASGKDGEAMPLRFCHGVADYGAFLGVNGSYVGSTCALRFDERTGAGLAVALNAWAAFERDVAVNLAARELPMARPRAAPPLAPVFEDISVFEGEYEGLMLATATTRIIREGDQLLCTIERKGAPDLHGRLARDGEGRLALAGGAAETALAAFESPDGNPVIMVGTSACRKLAS